MRIKRITRRTPSDCHKPRKAKPYTTPNPKRQSLHPKPQTLNEVWQASEKALFVTVCSESDRNGSEHSALTAKTRNDPSLPWRWFCPALKLQLAIRPHTEQNRLNPIANSQQSMSVEIPVLALPFSACALLKQIFQLPRA